MKRNIQLSEGTQTLVNATLDLERITGEVYSLVRDEFAKSDTPDDKTGDDIIEASNQLRERFDHYLRDRFNFGMILTSNQNGTEVVL